MAKASDNVFPKLIVAEGTAPSSPSAGQQKLFVDSADHKLKRKDSAGTVTTVEGGAYTDPTTTKGDLLARSASAASRLPVGADGTTLVADAAQTLGVKYENRVKSVVAGTGVTVDSTDPLNPIVAAAGGGGGASWTSAINDALSSTAGLLATLSGTWAINAGVLRSSNAAASRISHATVVTPAAIRAAQVECSYISGAAANARMGLIVSSSNATGSNLLVYAESSNGTTWVVKVEVDGVVLVATTATISYTGSGFLRLGVIQSGTMLDIYIGGVWFATVNAISSNQFLAGKYVGLYTNVLTADFKNLKAWSFLPNPF